MSEALQQTDFGFIVGRHRMVCVLDAEKPQKKTVLRRYHFQLLRGHGEYAYRWSMDFSLFGTACPAFDSFQTPIDAARHGYLKMHRWLRSSAPESVKDFRRWFCKNVLQRI